MTPSTPTTPPPTTHQSNCVNFFFRRFLCINRTESLLLYMFIELLHDREFSSNVKRFVIRNLDT